MKKYLFLSAILALVLVGTVARGEENELKVGPMGGNVEAKQTREEWKEKRAEIIAEIKTNREEAQAKFAALREAIKTERDAAKAKIKEARLEGREKFLVRFDGAVERMEALTEKVDAAITRLHDKGVDTGDAEGFADTAAGKLTDAKEKITEINVLLAKSVDQLTAEDKINLRTLAHDTQTLLQEVHQALKDAVRSLREEVQAKLGEDKDEEGDDSEDEGENN